MDLCGPAPYKPNTDSCTPHLLHGTWWYQDSNDHRPTGSLGCTGSCKGHIRGAGEHACPAGMPWPIFAHNSRACVHASCKPIHTAPHNTHILKAHGCIGHALVLKRCFAPSQHQLQSIYYATVQHLYCGTQRSSHGTHPMTFGPLERPNYLTQPSVKSRIRYQGHSKARHCCRSTEFPVPAFQWSPSLPHNTLRYSIKKCKVAPGLSITLGIQQYNVQETRAPARTV